MSWAQPNTVRRESSSSSTIVRRATTGTSSATFHMALRYESISKAQKLRIIARTRRAHLVVCETERECVQVANISGHCFVDT